jgi:hypothetical protein
MGPGWLPTALQRHRIAHASYVIVVTANLSTRCKVAHEDDGHASKTGVANA